MNKILLTLLTFLIYQTLLATNEPILVNESTIILDHKQTKEIYFSFAEGDEIILDLKMVKGKHIKEVEIIEMPSNSIFSDYKVKQLNAKRVMIRNKGIYKFRFYSSSLTRRVCKINIHRIPSSESTKKFDTNWKWETVRDTTYIPYSIDSITGYNTIKYKETKRELISSEKIEELLMDKTERVHSETNLDNYNYTNIRVNLPQSIITDLKEEKVIAWAYWIGVGKEAEEAYARNVSSITTLAKGVANTYGTPLSGIAIGAISELIMPKIGEDVSYWFIPDYENARLFMNNQRFLQFDQGKGIAAYGKNTDRTTGAFYIALHNDNFTQGINVNIKIVVIKEVKEYEYKEYDRERKEPIIVKVDKERMKINETKIRIPVE